MSAYKLVSVDHAIRTALEECSSLASSGKVERVLTAEVNTILGRVVASDVVSTVAIPNYDASIKDGFAVKCRTEVDADDNVPVKLEVVGSSRAGVEGLPTIENDTCCYITTGGVLPPGADAVVMVENVTISNEATGSADDTGRKTVNVSKEVFRKLSCGDDIRRRGSDVQEGETVIYKGSIITEAEIGVLAMIGCRYVEVFQRPTVAIMSTGDEIVDPFSSEPLKTGQVRDANRLMLITMTKQILGSVIAPYTRDPQSESELSGKIIDHGIVKDDKIALTERFIEMGKRDGVDVVVCSGGVSMGDRDYVKSVLEKFGKIHYGRVLMKPGKPLTFATIRVTETSKPIFVFALPGNPVSSAVTFNLVVAPVLRALSGENQSEKSAGSQNLDTHQRVIAKLAQRLYLDRARPEYHRATLVWNKNDVGSPWKECWHAYSTGNQISSKLTNMIGANALIELPQGNDETGAYLEKGEEVSCILIGRWPQNVNSKKLSDVDCGAASKTTNRSGRILIGIVTISDRASSGVYTDISGPAIVSYMDNVLVSTAINTISTVTNQSSSHDIQTKELKQDTTNSNYHEFIYHLIPDERNVIESTLKALCDNDQCDLIITTGGTGPAQRDVTPEATERVCEKLLDGFGELMRSTSLKYVPTAILSRQVAGTRGSSLIINCPGKPKSIAECLDAVMPAVPYCIDLIGGRRLDFNESVCKAFRPKPK